MCGRVSFGFVVSLAVIVVSRILVPGSSDDLFRAQLAAARLKTLSSNKRVIRDSPNDCVVSRAGLVTKTAWAQCPTKIAHRIATTSTSPTMTTQAIRRPTPMGRILAWQTGQWAVPWLTCMPHLGQLITDGPLISAPPNSSKPSVCPCGHCDQAPDGHEAPDSSPHGNLSSLDRVQRSVTKGAGAEVLRDVDPARRATKWIFHTSRVTASDALESLTDTERDFTRLGGDVARRVGTDLHGLVIGESGGNENSSLG